MPDVEPSPPSSSLPPLPYHRETLEYLQREDPEVWRWFSSQQYQQKYADQARLDLLKSTYRLDRETHGRLYALADAAREKLGLGIPLTLYQGEGSGQLNMFLSYIPGEGHVGMQGSVGELLTDAELLSAFGHELGHHRFYGISEGQYLVCLQLLNALANDELAQVPHLESFRRYGLYTEIFADRSGLVASGDPHACISALVKLNTGLKDVDARSYLRQADEVFARDGGGSRELTHPESFIRARALNLWAARGAEVDPEVRQMIEGPPALERLDLLEQRRVQDLTLRLLTALLSPRWFQTDPVMAHARLFFSGFASPPGAPPDPSLPAALRAVADPRLRDYFCYVLLDFAAVGRDLEEYPLAAAFQLSEGGGLADRLVDLAAAELKLPKKKLAKIRAEAPALLARAAGRPG